MNRNNHMSDQTLYFIQSEFAKTDMILNQLWQMVSLNDNIVLFADAVLFAQDQRLAAYPYLYILKQDAEFYCVEYMKSALIPHSVLFKIIQKLKSGSNSFTLSEKSYLQRENLVYLLKLIDGELDFDTYKLEAINDRMQYEMRLETERIQQENIQKLRLIEAEKLQQQLRKERLVREKEKLGGEK